MTCYGCKHIPCTLYQEAYEKCKDDTDRYLVCHSVKMGCPEGYDRDNPCYPFEDMLYPFGEDT